MVGGIERKAWSLLKTFQLKDQIWTEAASATVEGERLKPRVRLVFRCRSFEILQSLISDLLKAVATTKNDSTSNSS